MFLHYQVIGIDIKMPNVRRFQPSVDIFHEARIQDDVRQEIDQLNDYRITGIKPRPDLDESPFIEENDPFDASSFEDIIEYRKRTAYVAAMKKHKPLLNKCLDIDIEEWDRLLEEKKEEMSDPFFGLEV